MSVCVVIDGDLVTFESEPTAEDIAAWRDLRASIQAKLDEPLPGLTAEQTARYRERIQERAAARRAARRARASQGAVPGGAP